METQSRIEREIDEFWQRHISKSTLMKKSILEDEKGLKEIETCKALLQKKKVVLHDLKVQGTRDLAKCLR